MRRESRSSGSCQLNFVYAGGLSESGEGEVQDASRENCGMHVTRGEWWNKADEERARIEGTDNIKFCDAESAVNVPQRTARLICSEAG